LYTICWVSRFAGYIFPPFRSSVLSPHTAWLQHPSVTVSMTLKIEDLLAFEMSKAPSLRGAHPGNKSPSLRGAHPGNKHQDTPKPSAALCSLYGRGIPRRRCSGPGVTVTSKNAWRCAATSLRCFMAWCLINNKNLSFWGVLLQNKIEEFSRQWL